MNEKNLPDDIASKSLNELTDLADEIIKHLENRNNLENTSEDYANLLKINRLIEKKAKVTVVSLDKDNSQSDSVKFINAFINFTESLCELSLSRETTVTFAFFSINLLIFNKFA